MLVFVLSLRLPPHRHNSGVHVYVRETNSKEMEFSINANGIYLFGSRQNAMGLIVALGEADQTAEGDLFWDDGESYGML